jgi:hypothetical protein
VSEDFSESAAELVLKKDPVGTQFVASPYWGENCLVMRIVLDLGTKESVEYIWTEPMSAAIFSRLNDVNV